jgi:hypothetical protein
MSIVCKSDSYILGIQYPILEAAPSTYEKHFNSVVLFWVHSDNSDNWLDFFACLQS